MDIKDILSVGLTAEDFNTLIEGLEAIPEKGLGQDIMVAMITGLAAPGSTPQHREEAKNKALREFRKGGDKIAERKDDLTVLKSKLIMLKRLLLSNEAIRMANEIVNSTPPPSTSR